MPHSYTDKELAFLIMCGHLFFLLIGMASFVA